MNTTEKGDKFESKSLDIIKKVIEEQQLGHMTEYIRIFQKKGYPSDKRKKDIKFDLTIEVWPPGAKRYLLLYIIECKDYEYRVPVNKIEDFHSKITQVAGVNVKGIFITNSPLQEGAYNIAESTGMMVIQGESSEHYKIILHKKSNQIDLNKIPIINATYDSSILDDGLKAIEKLIDKEILRVFQPIIESSQVSYNIDRLSKEQIAIMANRELDRINPEILKSGYMLSVEYLTEYLLNNYGLKIIDWDSELSSLGFCDLENNTIGINKLIRGTRRELFILSHEIGHYILHQKLSIGQTQYNMFQDAEYNFKTGKHDLKNPKHWIEWQANYFATSLIMPKSVFIARLWKCQLEMNSRKGVIFLDDQYENIKAFTNLVDKLSYYFSVTKTSAIYRLKELELINDQSRLKPIGKIITEFASDLFT